MYQKFIFRFEVYQMQKNMKLRFVKPINDLNSLDLNLFQKVKLFHIDEFTDDYGNVDGTKFEKVINHNYDRKYIRNRFVF